MSVELSEYLGAFEAQLTTTPSQSGLVKRSVSELQDILHKLGWRDRTVPARTAKDFGLFGPKTAGAWQQSAVSRKLNPAFDRASPTEAWVHPNTLTVMSGGQSVVAVPAAKEKMQPLQRSLAKKAVADTSLITKSVAELQSLLFVLGWTTKRLTADGKYGPQTKNAWGVSTKLRNVPSTFQRIDGEHAAVDPMAFIKLQSDASVARGTVTKPMPAPVASAAQPVVYKDASPAGTIAKSVSELQALLYALGWTKKKLTADGEYGPQTKNAWAISTRLRKVPSTFVRIDSTHAGVDVVAFVKLQQEAQDKGKAPGPDSDASKPKPPMAWMMQGAITLDDARNILYGIGWTTKKLPANSGFSTTQYAWGVSAKLRKIDASFKNLAPAHAGFVLVNPATMRRFIDDATKGASAPKSEIQVVMGKAVITPAKTTVAKAKIKKADPLQQQADVIIKAATSPVVVLAIQQVVAATGKFPNVQATGVWDQALTSAIVPLLGVQNNYAPAFLRALPKLLSKDQRTIWLLPTQATLISKAADVIRSKGFPVNAVAAGPSSPSPGAQNINITVASGAGTPGAAGAPGAAGSSGGSAPASVFDTGVAPAGDEQANAQPTGGATMTPTDQTPAGPDPSAADAWAKLVQSLQDLTDSAPTLTAAVEKATASGAVPSDLSNAYKSWVASANQITSRMASLISGSPELRSAIDASGSSVGLGNYNFGLYDGLSGYFAELASASDKAIELLQQPLPVVKVAGQPLAGFGYFGQAIPPAAVIAAGEAAVEAAPVVVRFGSVAWKGLLQLLSTRTVTVVGATAVAASKLSDTINGEVQSYDQYNQHLADLVSEGKLTPADAAKLQKPSPTSPIVPIAIGGVALGGLWIYLRNRKSGPANKKRAA